MAAQAPKQRPETTVIKLTVPVQALGEAITDLHIRRPKGKDFRKLRDLDSPVGATLDFAAYLAEVPASTIDELDAEDVGKVLEVVGGFLGKSLPTGRT